jgi:hypothetical protein
VGYENEWRCHRAISGGGELIDQGVHLIDLSRWFLGDLSLDYTAMPTYFWPIKGRGQLPRCAGSKARWRGGMPPGRNGRTRFRLRLQGGRLKRANHIRADVFSTLPPPTEKTLRHSSGPSVPIRCR